MEPTGDGARTIFGEFYLVAMIFILFDVEAILYAVGVRLIAPRGRYGFHIE